MSSPRAPNERPYKSTLILSFEKILSTSKVVENYSCIKFDFLTSAFDFAFVESFKVVSVSPAAFVNKRTASLLSSATVVVVIGEIPAALSAAITGKLARAPFEYVC